MLLRKILVLLSVLVSTIYSFGQVYEGFPEIKKYEDHLAKIDEWLQTDPNRCKSELDYCEKEALRTNNHTLLTLTYIYRGSRHYYVGLSDSALLYFDKAISLASKHKNERLKSTASIRKIFVLDHSSDAEIVLRMMKDEFADASRRKDSLNMIYALNGIAMFYERLDSTKACINSYMSAIKIAQQSNNIFEYCFLLNNRGLLKLRLNSPEEANKDLLEGLRIAKQLESVRLEITLRENLGYYYSMLDSLDQAEKEYTYALDISKRNNYHLLWFNSLVNLGVLERSKGNFNKSDSLLGGALQIAKDNNLNYAIGQIYLTLAQIKLEAKKYRMVDAYLDSARMYKKHGSPNEIQQAIYLINYQSLESQGKFEQALKAYKRYKSFTDSLNNRGHIQLMNEMQLKYDVEKSEKEKLEERRTYEKKLAKQRLDNAKLRLNIGIVSFSSLLLLFGLMAYNYRKKQQNEIEFSNALVNKLEDERSRIARDLHDGLGQSLVILKNKFTRSATGEQVVKDDLDSDFSNIIEEVRSISRSLIPPELRRLGLKPALSKLFNQVETSTDLLVIFECENASFDRLEQLDQVRLYRIIQELLNNTIKHANASSLKLTIIENDNTIELVYQDNGVGMDIEKALTKDSSLGLKSIEQRVRAMKGQLKYDKVEKGIRIRIKLKLK